MILSSIEGYVFRQKSLLDGNSELLPVLSRNYLSFVNTLRLNLAELGLKPERPNADPDLREYLKAQGAKV